MSDFAPNHDAPGTPGTPGSPGTPATPEASATSGAPGDPGDPGADDLFETVIQAVLLGLPEPYRREVASVAVFAEDEPDPALKEDLGLLPDEELFGLYTGTALTEQSVDLAFDLPPQVQIFRGPLVRYARELAAETSQAKAEPVETILRREIRVTLLHELGHHFGLDEDRLTELGYG